ncbi:protein male-specific lethal-1-like [Metopolophium dirhodum]|uniref:protein male-specific lethal-1-like n=1 Tax=Metopolophium dirhodum TaxID=44670 RepID=UPI00298F6B77|nr:protein male-specific lethal-1-like [Metopolophium dirhodum]
MASRQVLDDQNKMVMAASKITMVSDSDQRVASINHRVYPPATNNLSKLKVLSFLSHKFKEESKKSVALLNEKILQLTNEVDYLKQKLAIPNQYIAKPVAREKNLDVLPFTQVSSTCSSGIGNLSLAKIQDQQEQQDIKLKKQRIRQAASKQPNPDPLECNQTKQRRTSITQTQSAKIGKMQELSLITTDDAYYTCLGNYDPTKDEPVSKNTKSNLETPSWRVIKYSGRRSVKGTEIMSDRIFEKRHHKHEQKEQICKRRDLRRLRELIRVENLKQGRYKHHSQKSNNKKELTTLLPSPSNIKAIEITDKLPVSAFECNLYNLYC